MVGKTAVLIGLGKSGLGEALIRRFHSEGFQIILLGRNESKLKKCMETFKHKGINIKYRIADLSDSSSISGAFDSINNVDVLIYNAVARRIENAKNLTREHAEYDFSITVGGAISCVREAVPKMKEHSAILVTGGGVALTPSVQNSSMSLSKAALRNYVFSLGTELQEQGIFVGIVTIQQLIKEATKYSPEKIATLYWDLYKNQSNQQEIIY
ncbi:SDR family NAD(P)-dependent oxidoreductase [Sporolactobacillus sp. THM7-4]|nr:SDR family NAD(P)-dependent oxidoreductase [Sporolactobacillus sp. THM7-4]